MCGRDENGRWMCNVKFTGRFPNTELREARTGRYCGIAVSRWYGHVCYERMAMSG